MKSPKYQLLLLLLPVLLPCLLFAVVSLPLPHIYKSIEAALQGGDWQKRPIPPANQPPDLQGLRAALMSFQPRGDASHEDEDAAMEANSEMSCIPLPLPWLISCSGRICIICHCAFGPPPLLPVCPKCRRKMPLAACDFTPSVCNWKPWKSWKSHFSSRRRLESPAPHTIDRC